MVFSSQLFLFLFLPSSLLSYFLVPKRFRNLFLLLISFVFYAWASPRLLAVLLGSILINYLLGMFIDSFDKKTQRRRVLLVVALIANISMLAYFKYSNFFITVLNNLSHLSIPVQKIALPLGISFFTFSGISYILDIYSGRIRATKNILHFALFMSFFPKLIQGPIARYKDFAPHISHRKINVNQFADGIYRIVVGLSKKVIIADQLGIVVDQIFANPAIFNPASVAWLGAISYSLQIFFDFSGYTDMAIGLGKLFGFEIPENFNYPYISTSISEFWRRWHMTLSSWFRDYMFYPLERKLRIAGKFRTVLNTLIVFLLTGLWHGAGLNFILWGLWHGTVITIENLGLSRKSKGDAPGVLKWIVTMLVIIIGWVLFRSPDLTYAGIYLGVMFGAIRVNTNFTFTWFLNAKLAVILAVALLACVPWKALFPAILDRYMASNMKTIMKIFSFVLLLALSMVLVISNSYNSFIYFRF